MLPSAFSFKTLSSVNKLLFYPNVVFQYRDLIHGIEISASTIVIIKRNDNYYGVLVSDCVYKQFKSHNIIDYKLLLMGVQELNTLMNERVKEIIHRFQIGDTLEFIGSDGERIAIAIPESEYAMEKEGFREYLKNITVYYV